MTPDDWLPASMRPARRGKQGAPDPAREIREVRRLTATEESAITEETGRLLAFITTRETAPPEVRFRRS
jgi:hypothetical protein